MGSPQAALGVCLGEERAETEAETSPQRQRRASADGKAHTDRKAAGRLDFGNVCHQFDGHVGRHGFYSDTAQFSGCVTLSTDERE